MSEKDTLGKICAERLTEYADMLEELMILRSENARLRAAIRESINNKSFVIDLLRSVAATNFDPHKRQLLRDAAAEIERLRESLSLHKAQNETHCALYDAAKAEIERLRAEVAVLKTPTYYWDNRNLETAVEPAEAVAYDDGCNRYTSCQRCGRSLPKAVRSGLTPARPPRREGSDG